MGLCRNFQRLQKTIKKTKAAIVPAGSQKKKGFTLIELLIAIVLIVTGLVTLMGIMSVAIVADASLEYRLTALHLANEKTEQLKDMAFGSIAAGTETGSSIGFDWLGQRVVSINEPYGPNLLKEVTVTVEWAEKGSTQAISVNTFIANP